MELLPSRSHSRYLVYALSLHGIVFMGGLLSIRIQMTNEKQSAFEINGNGLFMILAIVSLLAVEVTSGLLFWTNIWSRYSAILKSIGIFSAYLAPFSLMMVLDHSPKHNLMLCLLGYIVFGIAIAIACYGVDDDDKNLTKSSPICIITYLGLVLVPLTLVLVLFVPEYLNRIVYLVIYLTAGLEAICFFIFFFKFMVLSEEKQMPQSFEAYQVIHIQQDKNKDWEVHHLSGENKIIKDLEAHLVIKLDKNNDYP